MLLRNVLNICVIFVTVAYHHCTKDTSIFRFMTASGFEDNGLVLQQPQGELDEFSSQGDISVSLTLEHLLESEDMPSSLQEQLTMLGCISNYHWGTRRPLHSKSGFTTGKSHTPLVSHFSFPLSWAEEVSGQASSGHFPNSPRNLVTLYHCSDNYPKARANILHLLRAFQDDHSDDVVRPHSKRRRVSQSRSKIECPRGFLALDANMADNVESDMFTTYVQHMTSDEAVLLWRVHNQDKDVFVMNDIDSQTGAIKPSSVVHVCRQQMGASVQYTCTCQLFRHVQCTSFNKKDTLCNDSKGIFFQATCAHCRFLREYVEEHINHVTAKQECQNKMQTILQASFKSVNAPIVLACSYSSQTIAKFSVVPSATQSESFIHISRHGYISCQSGECRARIGITRGIRTLSALYKAKALCPHLTCVAEHPALLADVAEQRSSSEDHNLDDEEIMEEMVGILI